MGINYQLLHADGISHSNINSNGCFGLLVTKSKDFLLQNLAGDVSNFAGAKTYLMCDEWEVYEDLFFSIPEYAEDKKEIMSYLKNYDDNDRIQIYCKTVCNTLEEKLLLDQLWYDFIYKQWAYPWVDIEYRTVKDNSGKEHETPFSLTFKPNTPTFLYIIAVWFYFMPTQWATFTKIFSLCKEQGFSNITSYLTSSVLGNNQNSLCLSKLDNFDELQKLKDDLILVRRTSQVCWTYLHADLGIMKNIHNSDTSIFQDQPTFESQLLGEDPYISYNGRNEFWRLNTGLSYQERADTLSREHPWINKKLLKSLKVSKDLLETDFGSNSSSYLDFYSSSNFKIKPKHLFELIHKIDEKVQS